jgi:hypothetical protein
MRLLHGYEMTSNAQPYIVKIAKFYATVRSIKNDAFGLCDYTEILQKGSDRQLITPANNVSSIRSLFARQLQSGVYLNREIFRGNLGRLLG